MCKIGGIFSFTKLKNKQLVYNMVRKMLVDMESGGPHATGVALIDSDLDLKWVFKKDVRATEFVNLPLLKKAIFDMSYNIVLLHTRYATHGSPKDNNNNHPFLRDNNFLIHNGVIHNYKEICDTFDVTLESECDSECILAAYNSTFNVKKVIKELTGSNAFALFDGHLKKLYIWGSGNEVEIVYNKTKDIFVFNTRVEHINSLFVKYETLFSYFKVQKQSDELFNMNRMDSELVTIDFINEKFKKESIESKGYKFNAEIIEEEDEDDI
jgi:glucosamine 6-phosphate synthetase-like amidotransferase/phosphosugar isomerase protein